MQRRKVVVVGLGYIGLPTAAMLALHGSRVVGVDIRREVLEALREGTVPIREKDLTAIVRDALRSGRMELSETPVRSEYFIVCVLTPLRGHRADLSYVRSAVCSITPFLRKGSTVIHGVYRAGRDFHLACCPERVLPGGIVHEIAHNDRVIGGIDRRSAEMARDL